MAQFPFTEARHGYNPLRLSKGVSISSHGAFPVTKKALWVDEFNMSLMRLVEGGIISHITDGYILPKCLRPEKLVSPPPSAFQVEHVLLALGLLVVGLFVSSIMFLFECRQKIYKNEN